MSQTIDAIRARGGASQLGTTCARVLRAPQSTEPFELNARTDFEPRKHLEEFAGTHEVHVWNPIVMNG